MAGSTSNVSAQPTIARTNQKGTMMPVIGRIRPIATLIEWDNEVPAWPVLRQEAEAAQAILDRAGRSIAA